MVTSLVSSGAVLVSMLVVRRELEEARWQWLILVAGAAALLAFATTRDAPSAACVSALATACAAIAAIDMRKMIVPDVLVLVLAVLAFVAPFRPTPMEQLVGAIVLGALFVGVRGLYYWLRATEGLGLGDVKLAIVSGALLGAHCALLAVAAAAVLTAAWLALHGRRYAHAQSADIASIEAPFGVGIAAALFAGCLMRALPS